MRTTLKMALTYEQLAPALYKQARALAKKCFAFEADELVAECWLIGNVQKLKTIKYASKRAYYDMIDYIRLQTGCRNTKKAKAKGKFVPKTTSLYTVFGAADDNKEHQLKDILPGKSDGRMERIDTKDLFEKLCKGLDRQESLILKLIYVDGFNQAETGRVIGHSESRVSQLLKNLLPRIRVILENLKLTENVNKRIKEFKIPFKADTKEYRRIYHQRNGKRLSERATRKKHAGAV